MKPGPALSTALLHTLLGLTLTARCLALDEFRDKTGAKMFFTPGVYIEHVKYLASDALGGRGTGSEGIDRAAEYIAEKLGDAGCKPAGVDGTWYQPFEVRRGKRLIEEQASLEIEGLERTCELRRDWIPMPFSKTGQAEGPLAFVGFGIDAPEHTYNDYADFDVEGKVLLMLRYEPRDENEEAEFGGKVPSSHSMFIRKARVAAEKGAAGILIVNPPSRGPEEDSLYSFDPEGARQSYRLPMVHITRALADAILSKANMPELKALEDRLSRERKPLSEDLNGLTVTLKTGLVPRMVPARNVIGLLEGAGGADEIIVVGAHYDHLGTSPRAFQSADDTPRIHNGADDNASGTAGILELARAFGEGPRPRRNLLFIAFGAEELGLLGSRHFVNHPTVELNKIRAMLNFDMIGRLGQGQFVVYGTGTAQEFPDIIARAAEAVDLEYVAPRTRTDMFDRSDHANFYRKDIPVLFPFTGTHKQYHQPEDDWELIDAQGAARLLQMSYHLVADIANLPEGPTLVEDDQERPLRAERRRPRREQDEGEPAERADDDAPRMPGVRLGVMPDYADDQPGLLVASAVAGGAAQKAGIQDGDRILKIGQHKIEDVYSYMEALGQFKPGDVVEVVVDRKGESKTLQVTLEAPPRRPAPD